MLWWIRSCLLYTSRYIAPAVFSQSALDYVQEHLRILSGFYGVLRPFDGVAPYRLEMQAKLRTDFCKDLYDFWGGKLAEALSPDGAVIDLASGEYSRAVVPHPVSYTHLDVYKRQM